MSAAKKSFASWLGGVGLVVGLVLAWSSAHEGRRGPHRLDLQEWTVLDLVEHLRRHGVKLQVVSTGQGRSSEMAAFLTTTDRPWPELNALPKWAETLERWRGVVYCERLRHPASRAPTRELSEEACLVVGPFFFFGDKQLLQSIHDAL